MGLGDPTACVYTFIFDKNDGNNTKIIHYFIMHGLGLCKKLNSFVSYVLYAWSFSYNISVESYINNNKYFLFLNTYTNVFAWRSGN